ncbi:MAG: pirin family protein [Marmoricola sp.]
MNAEVQLEVRRAADRFETRDGGRTTQHSFSFGEHYDPANLGFASIIAVNDEHLPPTTGYPDHRHSDVEIVTWVVAGALRHSGADGSSEVLLPGDVQRISAGTGIVHAETTEPGVTTRFVQTWLRPDVPGAEPSYALVSGSGRGTAEGGLTEVVGALGLGTAGARLHLGGGAAGELLLPDAPRLHVFVADGLVELDGHRLRSGDAARMTDLGGKVLTVLEPGAVAVWAFGG